MKVVYAAIDRTILTFIPTQFRDYSWPRRAGIKHKVCRTECTAYLRTLCYFLLFSFSLLFCDVFLLLSVHLCVSLMVEMQRSARPGHPGTKSSH